MSWDRGDSSQQLKMPGLLRIRRQSGRWA